MAASISFSSPARLHGLGRAGHDLFQGRTPGHIAHILGKIADGGPLGAGDLTAVHLLFAGDDTEDGGLAGAVRTDQSGA